MDILPDMVVRLKIVSQELARSLASVSNLEGRPCLDDNIIHVSSAKVTKKRRQGDDIGMVITPAVLSDAIVLVVSPPAKLEQILIELVIA